MKLILFESLFEAVMTGQWQHLWILPNGSFVEAKGEHADEALDYLNKKGMKITKRTYRPKICSLYVQKTKRVQVSKIKWSDRDTQVYITIEQPITKEQLKTIKFLSDEFRAFFEVIPQDKQSTERPSKFTSLVKQLEEFGYI